MKSIALLGHMCSDGFLKTMDEGRVEWNNVLAQPRK